jgi:hypothetical protein
LDDSPLRLTNGFYVKLLAFNLWVHPGDAMQVGKRNPLGTVTFTGIDFAANPQTAVSVCAALRERAGRCYSSSARKRGVV